MVKPLGVSDRRAFLQELKDRLLETDLHGLKSGENPFCETNSISVPDPIAQLTICHLYNFAVMRNYAAHHDCLDSDIVYSDALAKPAVESLVFVSLTALSIARSP